MSSGASCSLDMRLPGPELLPAPWGALPRGCSTCLPLAAPADWFVITSWHMSLLHSLSNGKCVPAAQPRNVMTSCIMVLHTPHKRSQHFAITMEIPLHTIRAEKKKKTKKQNKNKNKNKKPFRKLV